MPIICITFNMVIIRAGAARIKPSESVKSSFIRFRGRPSCSDRPREHPRPQEVHITETGDCQINGTGSVTSCHEALKLIKEVDIV
jgi:hypothetical protein